MSSTRLAALVCAGTPELGQVVEIVQFDEALTASLLRSANSSWSASRSEITTVRDAVIRLGASPVLALTLGMNVRRHLGDSLPQYGLERGHALAPLGGGVARGRAPHVPGRASPAARGGHRRPPARRRQARDGPVPRPALLDQLHELEDRGATRLEAEAAVLGIDHAELGGLIARSWGLPDSLVQGIREHGRPRPGATRSCTPSTSPTCSPRRRGPGPTTISGLRRGSRRSSRPRRARPHGGRLRRAPGLVAERLDEVERRFD